MSQIRRLLPSLNSLVSFEAVVRCGNFAKAAKELGVTGPAISRMINRLERHLGIRLFMRKPTGAELTEEGKLLFSEVSESFSSIEKALLGIRNEKPRKKLVRFSSSPAFVTYWFMPRIDDFQKAFPDVELQFQFINGPLDCAVADADIAMRFDPEPNGRYAVFTLMPEILIPVQSPNFTGHDNEYSPEFNRMITLSDSRFHWTDILASNRILNTDNDLKFSDYSVVVQAALMGQGSAIGWLSVVSTLLANGLLVPSRPMVIPTGRRCVLLTSENSLCDVCYEICKWMLGQYHADIAIINDRYTEIHIDF